MKIYKYVSVFVALVAMSLTFISCDRDKDITGNPFDSHTQGGYQDYWIDFKLSNAGSLSQEAQDRFKELVGEVIYNDKTAKIIEHPMYNTEDYVRNNFNKIAAIADAENDIVQKIMIPTFCVDTPAVHNDFVVTMTLSRDSMRSVIAEHSWNATSTLNVQEIMNKNK